MQLDVTLGFEDAPFGYMRRSDYQFEPICASSHVFELGVMDSAQQGPRRSSWAVSIPVAPMWSLAVMATSMQVRLR